MNENLNLVEILKDCPIGTMLYCTIFGEVEFDGFNPNPTYPISVLSKSGNVCQEFTKTGLYLNEYKGECLLFPSRTQRDWSKFTAPKKPKEDLKIGTLVLAGNKNGYHIRVYAGHGKCYSSTILNASTVSRAWNVIIPYTFGNKAPSETELNDIKVTEENNYGTSYWDKFKEEKL